MSDLAIAQQPIDDDLSNEFLAKREAAWQQGVIERARRRMGGELGNTPADRQDSRQPRIELPSPDRPQTAGTVREVAGDIGRGVLEAPAQFTGGLLDALENTADLGEQLIPLAGIEDPEAERGFPTVAEPETVTGGVVRSVGQFVIPFGKIAKAVGVGRATTTAGRVGRAAGAGAITDALVFDGNERLADLLVQHPELRNPVTEFLESNPDDPEALQRFKNAVEGLIPGTLADGFAVSLRALRAARARSKGQEAPRPSRARETVQADAQRSLAKVAGNPSKPVLHVSDATRTAARRFLETGADLPAEGVPAFVGNINMSRIGGPEDVRQLIAKTATLFEGRLAEGVQTLDQTTALAREISIDPKRVQGLLQRGAYTAEEITALRFLLHSSGENLKAMAAKISGGDATDIDRFAFERAVALHGALIEQTSASAQNAGRALGAFRIAAQGQEEQLRSVREILDQGGGDISADRLAAMVDSLDTPEQINTFLKGAAKATGGEMYIEAWINGLLSGPTTHTVNIVGNSLVAAWQIPERVIATQYRELIGGEGVVPGEARAQLFGMIAGMKDGFKLAFQSFIKGTSQIDPAAAKLDIKQRGITAQNFGLEGGPFAAAIDGLGTMLRLPGRALMSEDVFFQAVGYRMELHARAFRQATEEGLQGRDFAERVTEIVRNPPEDIRLAAIDQRRIQTFTQPLGEMGQGFTRWANAWPGIRLIFPFIRTPLNIMKFVGERSPLGVAFPNIRADLKAGGARADLAMAKMTMGSIMMGMAGEWAAQGLITGAGPSDPTVRAALMRTGWRPYSIRIGDQYISFNRMDPVGAFLGIGADTHAILGQVEDEDAADLVAASIAAVSNNVMSKTYFEGFSTVVHVFDNISSDAGVAAAERLLNRMAPSMLLPFSSALRTARRATDPVVRDPGMDGFYSIWNSIRNTVPTMSEDLPPRRNLWGEPIMLTPGLGPDFISPLYASSHIDSPVDQEIIRLGKGPEMPQRTINVSPGNPVQLTAAEYSRYVELAAGVNTGDDRLPSLRETLAELIKSPEYAEHSDGPDGTKVLLLKRVASRYKAHARQLLIRETPRLQNLALGLPTAPPAGRTQQSRPDVDIRLQ